MCGAALMCGGVAIPAGDVLVFVGAWVGGWVDGWMDGWMDLCDWTD